VNGEAMAGGLVPAVTGSSPVTVSVVICTHSVDRLGLLERAVGAVRLQTQLPLETIVVVDGNEELRARAAELLPGVHVVANARAPGRCGARNTGVDLAAGGVVAFLDDDAVPADAEWLRNLTRPYVDPVVIGTGGEIDPLWEAPPPRWLPREFYWVFGCTYRGAGDRVAELRNPIGANMSFRREVLIGAGGFLEALGHVGGRPHGCDETEFCVRAAARYGGAIINVPEARVVHFIPAGRTTWTYFRRRCWLEGHSKATVRWLAGERAVLARERRYVMRTLTSGVARGLVDAARGDLAGLRRSGAIAAGLAITAGAYADGVLRGTGLRGGGSKASGSR
jgi:glucosyl-dolichyl phosphate glucuronosyltransferase